MRLNASKLGLFAGVIGGVVAQDEEDMSTTALPTPEPEHIITFTPEVFGTGPNASQIFHWANGDKMIQWRTLPDNYRVKAINLYKRLGGAADGDVHIGSGEESENPSDRTTNGNGRSPVRRGDDILPDGDVAITMPCMRPLK